MGLKACRKTKIRVFVAIIFSKIFVGTLFSLVEYFFSPLLAQQLIQWPQPI